MTESQDPQGQHPQDREPQDGEPQDREPQPGPDRRGVSTRPQPGRPASDGAADVAAEVRRGIRYAFLDLPLALAGFLTTAARIITGGSDAAGATGGSRPRSGPSGRLGRPSFGPVMWREIGYLLLNLPLGIAGFVLTVVGLATGTTLVFTVIGIWVLAGALAGVRALGTVERRRARRLLGEDVPEPLPVAPRRKGWLGKATAVLGDGLAWRSALYFFLMLPWGIFTFTVALVAVIVMWPVLPWVARGLATVDRLLVASLLTPGDLTARVRELEDDRSTVVDSAAADLRRIERDLHDGAQARLVALAMDLGLAKEKMTEDPEAAARMVDAAHGEVKVALQELRDLARGIHPAVLTDRGLDAALSSVAPRCTVPGGVQVHVDLESRPDSAIEGIAYFTVSELLTNISKHARARTATVEVWRADDRLMLQVRDDGRGGAVEEPGGGLAGLADRVRAVDGVFDVSSPEGGPTNVTVELPWRTRTQQQPLQR